MTAAPFKHQVSALETEIAHLQSSVTTCEGLLTEYRSKVTVYTYILDHSNIDVLQLEKSHRENEELSKELRKAEQQVEHCRQECALESEKVCPTLATPSAMHLMKMGYLQCHMRLQQQLSEMESMPELLKVR